ncbi:MAG: carboxymuconolactone decarboxylase family protein [Acidimicrobiia bacterium]
MNLEHLPEIYTRFREAFPDLVDAIDGLGAASDAAGPLDEKQRRLVKLAIAVGAQAPGSVRSNVRRALAAGATSDEILHIVTLAVATLGLSASVAAYGWVSEVLDRA